MKNRPEKITLKYAAKTDGRIVLSVDPREGTFCVWQYCASGTLDWIPVGKEGTEMFLISPQALLHYGDKYRCIGYRADRAEYYSNVLTISPSFREKVERKTGWHQEQKQNAYGQHREQRSDEQRRKSEKEQEQTEARAKSVPDEFDFFRGCTDRESVEARYRRLMQAYHPDHKGGDEETAKILSEQYSKLKELYEK